MSKKNKSGSDETIKVTDYGAFSDAVSTINTLNEEVDTEKSTIQSKISEINNDSTFAGPIADSMKEGFDKLSKAIDLIADNFSILGKELTTISQNYKSADDSAQKVMFIIKNEKVEIINHPIYINENASDSKVEFINQILPGALDLYNKYGILPSLTLGQAAHESGWGDGDSLFGIKATSGWKGDIINAGTWEEGSGGAYNTNANFRAYDSVNSAIEDYGEVIKDSFPKVLDAKDYQSAVEAVQDGKWGKYATDSAYIPKVTNIIEEYNLDQWDPK